MSSIYSDSKKRQIREYGCKQYGNDVTRRHRTENPGLFSRKLKVFQYLASLRFSEV